jgi:transforming growth factor-beta-induced protein
MKIALRHLQPLALMFVTASCGSVAANKSSNLSSPEPTTEQRNIVEIAQDAGNFSTLLQAAAKADLADTLATTENLTVFAPTDAAFAKIPGNILNELINDKEALKNVLTYHVIAGRIPSSTAMTLSEATMLNGKKVALKFDGKDLWINDAKVIAKDIMAKNGIIHVIDTVLLPTEIGRSATCEKNIIDTATEAGNFKTLLYALRQSGFDKTLATAKNLTVFAPDDAAFAKVPSNKLHEILSNQHLLQALLKRHVVAGASIESSLFYGIRQLIALNGFLQLRSTTNPHTGSLEYLVSGIQNTQSAKITAKDVKASNGIIHVIDQVLPIDQNMID